MYLAIIVLIINFLYFVVELASGFYFNSTALKTDAFHMLADILAICISIYCEYLSKFKKITVLHLDGIEPKY
jgi:zinc transporter 1